MKANDEARACMSLYNNKQCQVYFTMYSTVFTDRYYD